MAPPSASSEAHAEQRCVAAHRKLWPHGPSCLLSCTCGCLCVFVSRPATFALWISGLLGSLTIWVLSLFGPPAGRHDLLCQVVKVRDPVLHALMQML